MTQDHRYPALLLDWLTPLYDLFAGLFIPEKRLKRDLIAQAGIAPGYRGLDLGAGTGTLAILIKQTQPEAQVIGIDADPDVLSIAHEKTLRSGVEVTFVIGSVATLPYASQSFDRVVSTLVMSVLSSEKKRHAIQEAYRVLVDGGELFIADFSAPHTRWGRWVAPVIRRFEPIIDNLDGLLPDMFREAGFAHVAESKRYATIFGTISILSGRKT